MNPTPPPFPEITSDPFLTVAWIATSSVAAGALLGTVVASVRIRGSSVGIRGSSAGSHKDRGMVRLAAVLALPLLIVGLGAVTSPGSSWSPLRALPTPASAGLVLAGMVLLGASLAPWADARSGWPATSVAASGLARAVSLLLIAACLDGAAVGWGIVEPRPPWGPELTAFLLDLSPRTLVLEAGGVDWMRHEAIYGPAGTDRLGPGIRTAWDGSVAGPLLLVVGCVAAAVRCGVRAR